MKKLFLLYWLICVYSGNSGRLMFRTEKCPRIIHNGRWIYFVNEHGKETYISARSNVIFYESED